MEKLKNLMALAKQDFEKVLLVTVVLALALAVGLLYSFSGAEQVKAENVRREWSTRKTKQPPAVDIAHYRNALASAQNPPVVDLGLPHKLFNPVKWMRGPEGRFVVDRLGKSVGPEALKIESIRPLNRTLRVVSASPEGYLTEITFEASDRIADRKARQFTMKTDEKVRLSGGTARNPNQLWLKAVKGKAEDPDEFVFEITENKESIVVPKGQPSVRAEAYVADMNYPAENRQYKNLRRDSAIVFGGEEYKIVDISENEVVVSNRLNDKKTRLKRTATAK